MNSASYPTYFRPYIDRIPENADPLVLLKDSLNDLLKTLAMVSEEQANTSYEEGKWSVKDIVQHIIDTERIFCFRALSIARGEKHEIFGFDHNAYAEQGKANKRRLKSLLEELKNLRLSTIDLFASIPEENMNEQGVANKVSFTPKQLMYVVVGHQMHHLHILESRYLS